MSYPHAPQSPHAYSQPRQAVPTPPRPTFWFPLGTSAHRSPDAHLLIDATGMKGWGSWCILQGLAAEHANQAPLVCSVRWLAKELRTSPKFVQKLLGILEDLDLIRINAKALLHGDDHVDIISLSILSPLSPPPPPLKEKKPQPQPQAPIVVEQFDDENEFLGGGGGGFAFEEEKQEPPPQGLIFPASFTYSQREAASKLLKGNPQAQELLDELQGRIELDAQVANPLGYLRSMVKRTDFSPELGVGVADRRAAAGKRAAQLSEAKAAGASVGPSGPPADWQPNVSDPKLQATLERIHQRGMARQQA
ncbi:MAG: hypothetical protein HQL51_04480 [Magnetococcales bacterium]|nr:hypothetical protein [Magnetococcales bacterium]